MNCRVNSCVVPKFGEVKEFIPATRMVTDKTSKVGFKGLIDNFGLAVGLWVVRCAVFQGCSLDSKQFFPERAQKQRVLVRDYGRRNAMKAANLIKETGGYVFCCKFRGKCDKMDEFGETVTNDPNDSMSKRVWEVSDKVHGKFIPNLGRYG